MDPNETLRRIRRAAAGINNASDDVSTAQLAAWAYNLAEHVEALDEWLSKGGFKPDAWSV